MTRPALPIGTTMRVFILRHGWWLFGVPALLFALPSETALALTLPIAGGSLIVSARSLRHQPNVPDGFKFLYSSALALLLAMVVRSLHAEVSGLPFPYPSPADILAIAGYTLALVGAVSIARERRAFGGHGDAFDTLILAFAIAGPFWAGVLGNYFTDNSYTIGHRALSGVYAVIEVAIAAVVLRLAAGPGSRPKAYWFLATSLTCIALLDAIAILDTIGRPGTSLLVPLASIGYLGFAQACGADDLDRLLDRPPASDPRLTTSRLATLCVGLATVPALLVIDTWVGGGNSWITFGLASTLSLLLLARIVGLLRSRDKAADFDAALQSAGQQLLAADRVDDMTEIIESTATAIWPGCELGIVLRCAEHTPRLVDGVGGNPLTVDAVTWAHDEDASRLVERHSASEPSLQVSVALGPDGRAGAIVCTPAMPMLHTQSLALQTFAAQVGMALQSLATREIVFQRRSAQRLTALVEQSADLITVLDDGIITFVSPNAAGILGLDASEVIGHDPLSAVHADDVAAVRGLIQNPSTSEQVLTAIEARVRGEAGEYRWFSMTTRDFRDDPEVGGIVLTGRDVTEERAAKIGLERSEQWFRGLVQHSSDVISVLDEAGIFTYSSPAIEALTGLTPSEVRGRSFIDLLPVDDLASVERVRQAIRSQTPGLRSLEIRIGRTDGSRRIAEATVTDLRDDPSVRGLVLNIRDVTDRKKLEEDLRHQVLHDDLTGLGSRVQFSNQLAEALGPNRRPGSMVAALEAEQQVQARLPYGEQPLHATVASSL